MIVEMNKLTIQPGREWPKALASQPKLRASMAQKGQLRPLLVNAEYQIIDGAWRYLEAQALGWTEIDVHVATSYNEACEFLGETRLIEPETAQPIDIWRTWYIIDALEPLLEERTRERRRAMTGIKRGNSYKHKIRQPGEARILLADALGKPGETYIQIIKRMRVVAMTKGPQQNLAQQLWQEMVDGTRTIYSAYGILRRSMYRGDLVTDAATQRTVLKGAMPVADALIVSLSGIGEIADGISAAEAADWATKLRKLRTIVAKTNAKLNQHKTTKENEA